ncbi:MAG TPA: hypothetical protein VIM30_09370 [Candidatus Limnocylindrales bacterium]|jgi:hypothetical protein
MRSRHDAAVVGRATVLATVLALALAPTVLAQEGGAAAAPATTPGDPITLVLGSAYTVVESGDLISLRIPIVLRDGVAPASVTIIPTNVTLDASDQPALVAFFTTVGLEPGTGRNATLPLSIRATGGLRPGTYVLSATVVVAGDPLETQSLSLQITHPAATLQLPATLIVERKLGILGNLETSTTQLQLRESSGQSRVSGLTALQIDPAKVGDQTIAGRIVFNSAVDLTTRGIAKADIASEGTFPAGIAIGSLQLDAAQLQMPVSLPYEVRTRGNIFWLFMVAAVGLLLSVLTRTAVKEALAVQGARADADRLLAVLDRELSDRQDRDFQRAITEKRTELLQVRGQFDAKAIADATTAAQAALNTELDGLSARHVAERASVDALRAALASAQSRLPRATDYLRGAAKDLSAIDDQLEHSDVAGAVGARKALETRVVGELASLARAWHAATGPITNLLMHPVKPLDVRIAADAKTFADELQTALGTASIGDLPLDAIVTQLSIASERADEIEIDVLPGLHQAAVDVIRTLKAGPPADPEALNALSALTEQLGEAIKSGKGVLDGDSGSVIAERGAAVVGALPDTIKKQVDPLPAGFQGLLDAGEYLKAAEAAAPEKERALGAVDGGSRDVMTPTELRLRHSIAPAGVDAAFVARSPTGSRMTAEQVATQAHRTIVSLFLLQALQTALLGVVVLVNAYVLYQATYVGSGLELAGIFLWAFALDITLDAVVTAARTAGGTRQTVS